MPGNTTDTGIQPPTGEQPDIEPDIEIMEVRGETEIGFMGMKHVQMPEEEKDKIHDVYADIIIDLDDIKNEYEGADRAWHIGRILDEYNVTENDEMTLEDLGAYNTIGDMYARRLFFARYIFDFWPDQGYDPEHSITALGEFASRALNQEREEQARNGYERLMAQNEPLTKGDVLAWGRVAADAVLAEIVAEVSAEYDTPSSVAESVKRVVLLMDRALSTVSKSELESLIKNEFST